METPAPAGRPSSASSAARSSMRLLVMACGPSTSQRVPPKRSAWQARSTTTKPVPPGPPGLVSAEPSTKATKRASWSMSGRMLARHPVARPKYRGPWDVGEGRGRPMRIAALLLACTLAPLPAAAGEGNAARVKPHVHCNVDAGPNDLVARGKDLVVEKGKAIDTAVALEGNVVVKAGAEVRQVMALGGSIVLERGAVVRESAIAVGGDVRAGDGARIGKDAFAL